MTLSALVVLLQIALTLLSTPNMTAAQQAQAIGFANQAVQIASQAVIQNPTSSLPNIVTQTPASQAPVIQPVQQTQQTQPTQPAQPVVSVTPTVPYGFSWTPVGATSGRGKSTNDEIADITFNPANGGAILLNNMTITFSGTAASSTGFLSSAKLIDPSGNTTPTSSQTADCSGSGTCSVTFNFGGRLDSGPQTYKLTIDDSKEAIAQSNNSMGLYVTINANTDVTYTDAPSGGTLVTLPAILQPGNQLFPLNLNSVTYAQGT